MQAVGVQVVGLEVGGGDEADPVLEQRHQQPVQHHRIGDVGHMEFVEADQPVALGHPLAQHVQRVDRALQVPQLAVHLAHELVEMQPRLALDRHRVEEAVHQEALAAPHAAVHVDALGDLRPAQQPAQRARTLVLVGRPVVCTALQRLDRAQLRRVALETAGGQFGLVGLANIHAAGFPCGVAGRGFSTPGGRHHGLLPFK